MNKLEVIYADNCGACGNEFFSSELIPIKLGSYDLGVKICIECLSEDPDIHQQYKEAADLIAKLSKEINE